MVVTAVRPLLSVVRQHAEESAILRRLRSVLVAAPHVKLRHLGRLDERIAAHLDGLAVAGEVGWQLCQAALETVASGEVFTAAVRAIESRNPRQFESLLALVQAAPESERGLISALGWVSPRFLLGSVKALLAARDPFRRQLGIAACVMHRLDPGAALHAAFAAEDPRLRARALRAAAECGRRDLLPLTLKALADEAPDCRFWGAWSALLLGDRAEAMDELTKLCRLPGPQCQPSQRLYLMAAQVSAGRALLKGLTGDDAKNMRLLLQGAGIVGDPHYVPWLIKQMDYPEIARLAGESFSLITGVDLAFLDLDRKPPEDFEIGPGDNPEDEDVEMDPDESLPWPDVTKVQAWWATNKQRFRSGVRYFMGEALNIENCRRVLREGYQRQRGAAALHLSLQQPGTPPFQTAAPAWRQQRWLAVMQ
jgi:uncharacterized protein (TIGR02270 family)